MKLNDNLKTAAALCGVAVIVVGGSCLIWAGTHPARPVPNTVAPPPAASSQGVQGADLGGYRINPLKPSEIQAAGGTGSSPGKESSVTVTTGEDGTVTIDREWGSKPDGAVTVSSPDQPVSNMQGGGGQMDVDQDGTYHGDVPDQPEAPAPSTPEQTIPKEETPKEDPPKQDTPKQDPPKEETPKEETPKQDTPKEEPKQDTPKEETPSSGGAAGDKPTKPGNNGDKVGSWMWLDGFGWVEMGKGNGGTGGGQLDPDATLSGNKVGIM